MCTRRQPDGGLQGAADHAGRGQRNAEEARGAAGRAPGGAQHASTAADAGRRATARLWPARARVARRRRGAGPAAAGRLRGRIRLSASSDLTRRLLLPLLDEFLGLHPAVELQLSVSDSMLDVYKDEVDLTLRYGPLADSNLVARRLTAVRRLAGASPGYPRRCGQV